MRKFLTNFGFMCLLLCLNITIAAADNKPLENTEFQVFKAETQLKLDTLKENQGKEIAAAINSRNTEFTAQKQTIDAFGGRISDLEIYIALAAIIITLLAIGASLAGFVTAKSRAEETAKTWFKENENGLRDRLKNLEDDVVSMAEQARKTIERTRQKAMAEAEKNLSSASGSAPTQVSPETKASLTEADTALKDKPESQYTYSDWNIRAYAAHSNKNLALAAEYWGNAAQAQDASDLDIAKALVNQGIAFEQGKQTDKALASFEEVTKRFGTSLAPELQEPVARALINQGNNYEICKQTDKAQECYAEVLKHFRRSSAPALQEHIASALLNQGFGYAEGKQIDKALACFAEVIERYDASPIPLLQGYVATALLNQGSNYGLNNHADKALLVYAEVIRRFGASTLPTLQEAVAHAKNGVGFTKLLQAKRTWLDTKQRNVLLDEALILFRQAEVAPIRVPAKKTVYTGNVAYCLWLLGRTADATSPLREALRLGGEELRDAELADTKLHTVAEDAGFVVLVNTLWDEVKPK